MAASVGKVFWIFFWLNMVDISMAISFFSCLCLSIRIRGQLRWGIGGIKQQTSEQTIKQTKHTSKKSKQTNKSHAIWFFFQLLVVAALTLIFFCTCFPNLLYYIQSRLNRKAARVDNFHLMTEAFNTTAHPKIFWDVLHSAATA